MAWEDMSLILNIRQLFILTKNKSQMEITKMLLIDFNETKQTLLSVQYFESKWKRELGDKINYDGHQMRVGAIGDSKDELIKAGNKMIAMQNKINRMETNKMINKFFNI